MVNKDYRDTQEHSKVSDISMNRRGFIGNSLSAGGVLSSVGLSGQLDFSDKTVEYEKLYRHINHSEVVNGAAVRKEPVKDTMPVRRWKKMEAAENAIGNLWNKIKRELDNDHISNIFIETTSVDSSYNNKLTVRYETTKTSNGQKVQQPNISFDTLASVVPDNVTGKVESGSNFTSHTDQIPVTIEKDTVYLNGCPSGPFYDDDHGKRIPGGCHIGCTSATPATGYFPYGSYTETVMLSAGHCFDVGDYMYQGGATADGYCTQSVYAGQRDYCRLSPENGADYDYGFANDNGLSVGEIMGTLSWDEIKNKKETEGDMYKRGRTTGKSQGHVSVTGCDSNGYRYFNLKGGINSDGGDSGGPHYDRYDGYYGFDVYIAGIHHGSWWCHKANAKFIGDAEAVLNVSV